MKSLRRSISSRLPATNPLAIRLRSMVTISEFIWAHPRDLLSNSVGARRAPGFGRLQIFFRHVHTRHNGRSRDPDKRRPEWFSHEHCFDNLVATIVRSPLASRVALTVVYDGTEAEFASDFISKRCARPTPFQLNIKLVQAGSNIKSWLELIKLVASDAVADDDVVFFVENDYLHVEGWLEKLVELYDSGVQFDYVSLYDHTDFYDLEDKPSFPAYRGLTSQLFVARSHHWREAPSTCGTFLVEKKVFMQDIAVWSSHLSDFYAFSYLRTFKRRVLVSPVPALSTHCMPGFLAPAINWTSVPR